MPQQVATYFTFAEFNGGKSLQGVTQFIEHLTQDVLPKVIADLKA